MLKAKARGQGRWPSAPASGLLWWPRQDLRLGPAVAVTRSE